MVPLPDPDARRGLFQYLMRVSSQHLVMTWWNYIMNMNTHSSVIQCVARNVCTVHWGMKFFTMQHHNATSQCDITMRHAMGPVTVAFSHWPSFEPESGECRRLPQRVSITNIGYMYPSSFLPSFLQENAVDFSGADWESLVTKTDGYVCKHIVNI